MDKLQPLIKHRFWILGGLTLPLAMYGFFSANSALKAETESRETTLKKVLSDIPKGANDPNSEYESGLSKINKQYEANVESSIVDIWNKQKSRMKWPAVVVDGIPDIMFEDIEPDVADTYRAYYPQLMRELQSRVQPVMPQENPTSGGAAFLGPAKKAADLPDQKVVFAADLPAAYFDPNAVTVQPQQVWDAQIDIWLVDLLFEAIRNINKEKHSVTEADIRRIDTFKFFGGSGEPLPTGAAGDASGGDSGYGTGGADMSAMMSGSMRPSAGSYGAGGGYGGGGGSKISVDIKFDPAQEFGSPVDTAAAAAASTSTGGYGNETGGYGGAAGGAMLRYIGDSEEKRVFERGFYLSVIMMQKRIPDFIVELANSEWPIRVTRFHVGRNPHYTETSPTLMSPMGMMGMTGMDSEMMSAGFGDAGGYGSGSSLMMGASYGGGGYGGLGGFGGAPTAKIDGVGNLTNNLPEYATAAMNHPDLVQVDLCGVISMFKQPKEVIDALTGGTSADDSNAVPATDSATTVPSETAPADGQTPPAEIPATEATESTESIETPAATEETETTPPQTTTEPTDELPPEQPSDPPTEADVAPAEENPNPQ